LKLNVFGSIRHTLQPSKLLHESVGIDPAGYKGSDLRSNKILDNQFLSTEEHAIHGLWREEQPTHSIVRLQDLRTLATHLKGPQKEDVLETSLMQECFNFNRYDLPPQSQTPWTTRVRLKDSWKRAKMNPRKSCSTPRGTQS